MDKEEALKLLRGGKGRVAEWNRRRGEGEEIPDLSDAFLSGRDLGWINLSDAFLIGAKLDGDHLRGADFREADLSGASLRGADLIGADFTGVDLGAANLSGADLDSANLSGADLSEANLTGANLVETVLAGAVVGWTLLTSVDLTSLCSTRLLHVGESTVDWRSVAKSLKADGLHALLVDTGMPEVVATYMIDSARSIDPEEMFTLMQSTFISFGGPDEEFARTLHDALKRNGVTTFFFPEHAEPGEHLHRVMRRGVEDHDRVILVCSKDSLDRPGVLNEIELALAKEAELEGRSLIIPVVLDNYLFDGWAPEGREDLVKAVQRRVVADFRDESKFDDSLQKLLRALRKKKPEAEPST